MYYGKEIGVMSSPEEKDGHESEVGAKNNSSGKDLLELPRVGGRRRLDSILGDGHYGSIIKYGNDKNHEGSEVEFPNESDEHESHHNTNGNGNCVYSIILHSLENGSASQDRTDDHT